jgi:hypothetical protein
MWKNHSSSIAITQDKCQLGRCEVQAQTLDARGPGLNRTGLDGVRAAVVIVIMVSSTANHATHAQNGEASSSTGISQNGRPD